VLVDVSANSLTLDQMTTLREYVRSEGRGLVATGGRSSFTLGGYKDTPLEEVLPVQMTPPPRPQRAGVTLLLIIDRSASMGPTTGASRFNMAKESAILATNALREGDRIGVLSFDTNQDWNVPFQQVGTGLSIAQIQEQVGSIGLGGGTDIYEALDAGLTALAAQPGQVRHAVLLTDGKSFSTTRRPYSDLIEQARAQNITLSSIAIGEDADTGLLRDLADWGAGRYYFASKPEDIPRLTLQESDIARSEPQVEGDFRADLQAPHPLLREFQPNQIPKLEGYVATTLKPEAELVLESPEKDPVLAVWQYGLGRAVAWTPSIEEPWASGWASWPEYGQFWGEIIRYTLPEPDSGPLQVHVTSDGDEATITADSLLPGGASLDLADTQATVTLPDGSTTTIPLRQVAPGRYSEVVKLPQVGPYAVHVQQQKDNLSRETDAGYVQPYSAEYLPISDGMGLLRQISATTGGQMLTEARGWALGRGGTEDRSTALSLWLLLAAALLWPVEIAVRRGWLQLGQ
jgi:Mg-chelatase subunit ChlD